ncbi:MAG: hypothetical protein P8N94_11230 [Gammaproteobacteria bacterium]|jgi:hypothetical protein|nr:hypothetical protein [Gammaproteobacteria bacterium]MDG2338536.1 hypothetical protein [Gammaproteobacteria bacterium]
MRKIAIEDLIQLLGVVGIIGSLIFVGLEMRQSQRIALAAQVQARAEMQTDRLLSSIEGNIDGYTLFTDANYSFAALTEEEKQVAILLHQWRGVMLENNLYQYRTGLFAEEYWRQTRNRIASWYNNCELRPNIDAQYVESFVSYLRSLPDRCAE